MKTQTRLLLVPLTLAVALAACKPATPPADAAPAAIATEAAADVAPIAVASGTYVIDPKHTMVLASWNHFGFSNPSINFGDVAGSIVYNADDVSASSVEVTLPVSGISALAAEFHDHLSSANWLDAAQFPTATFKSTSVAANGANKLTVTGDLTVKGTTKPVTLDVTLNGAGEHPMTKRPTVGFDATATVLRSDFGLGNYAPAVSDEVDLRITTEASVAAE
ncbi:MAG: YceI family protein [Luteimonas sp.]|nr:YceI family protein [Luteimonas sp.]